MEEELKGWTWEEAKESQKKAKKSGQEIQGHEVKGGQEARPEDKVEKAEEMADNRVERPHQEKEADGAGPYIEEEQGGGKLRQEWIEEEEGVQIMTLKIEIHSHVQAEQLLQAEKGQASLLDWAIKN